MKMSKLGRDPPLQYADSFYEQKQYETRILTASGTGLDHDEQFVP